MVDKLRQSIWIKLLFAISAAAFTGLQLSVDFADSVNIILCAANVMLTFALAIFLEYKFGVLEKLYKIKSKKRALISLLIAIYVVAEIILGFCNNWIGDALISDIDAVVQVREALGSASFSAAVYIVSAIAGSIALLFVFSLIYALISRLPERPLSWLWGAADKTERTYFIAVVLVLGTFAAYVYTRSIAFYNYSNALYDVDTGSTWRYMNLYFGYSHPDWVVKRFYYPVVFFPIGIIAHALSRILYFVPFSFDYAVQICHMMLMAAGGILISRMCGFKGASKVFFFAGYSLTYPFLAYSLIIDKYILSAFCVIILIFICVRELKGKPAAGLAAAGVMTTNAVFIPYLAYDKKVKTWLINIVKYALAFAVICIFCAELTSLVFAVSNVLLNLTEYGGGGVGWSDKALQYLNFIASCFTAPETAVGIDDRGRIRYDLAQPTVVNRFGIAFMLLSVAGFIANRKNRFSQLAIGWVLISFVIMFIFGWQSSKNEMFISAFYFSWAFFALIFMFFEKLTDKYKVLKYTLYSVLIAAMTWVNFSGIRSLVEFGAQYYPANY